LVDGVAVPAEGEEASEVPPQAVREKSIATTHKIANNLFILSSCFISLF